ncbi:MAG: xanthine dehydrogenase family protein molybdopterin-binding subunit [Desulfurococcales archaeon]|jgi:carbon-monoxide dehydrogenase large subunit|nr:xanthine dehydrogenase family protein molybdopterin-binding subunit [Desulfurococcales archaeon]
MVEKGYRYVGRPVQRFDVDKVYGGAVFASDLEIPGMLYIKLVSAPYAHARIKRIDFSEALKVPGVVAVFTGSDFPYKVGIYAADRDVLARGKILYYGHPFAAVVAEDLDIAERAAELIDLDVEPLPAVFTIEEALAPGAPVIHEGLGGYRRASFINPVPGSNIANRVKLRKGDAYKAMEEADVVVEETYRSDPQSHAYMETWAGAAMVRSDGTIEVWSSHQSPFAVRNLLAMSLNIPVSRIVVHHVYTGGGFGGKAGLLLEHIPVLISMKLGGRPVYLSLNREENFYYMAQKPGFLFKMRTGASKDGRLVAHIGEYYLDAGAYADYTVNVIRSSAFMATGPYEIPHISVDGYAVYTNKVPTTAFRGFGVLELTSSFEQQMDILAEKLGLDPVELRLKNALKPGSSTTPTQEVLAEDAGDPAGVIKRVAELIEYHKPPERPSEPWRVRGRGLAAAWKGPVQPPNAASSAIVKLNEDGSVDVLVGTGEFGQGTITALAQIVAEELGIPVEKVRISPHRSTDLVPYTWQTVGSRGLFSDGQALLRALQDLKEQIREVAARAFNVFKDEIEIRDGRACVAGKPRECLSLEQIALGYTFPSGETIHGPLIGRGSHVPSGTTYLDPETGRGNPKPFVTFVAGGVEVEVDLITMEVRVLKAAFVCDTPIVNPGLAAGQIYGGLLMGIGLALKEAIEFDETGALRNPSFLEYRLPRVEDTPPEIISESLGVPQRNAPYGAKGLGELTALPWQAAIANAIYRAIGVRVKEYPITRERLLKAVMEQRPELLEMLRKTLVG